MSGIARKSRRNHRRKSVHYVKVPHPVKLSNQATGEPIQDPVFEDLAGDQRAVKMDERGRQIFKPLRELDLWGFLARFVIGDAKMGKGEKGAYRGRRLRKAFKKAQPDVVCPIDTEDRDAVLKIMEEPSSDWGSAVTCQCTVFIDAFKKASEKEEEAAALVYDYDDEI